MPAMPAAMAATGQHRHRRWSRGGRGRTPQRCDTAEPAGEATAAGRGGQMLGQTRTHSLADPGYHSGLAPSSLHAPACPFWGRVAARAHAGRHHPAQRRRPARRQTAACRGAAARGPRRPPPAPAPSAAPGTPGLRPRARAPSALPAVRSQPLLGLHPCPSACGQHATARLPLQEPGHTLCSGMPVFVRPCVPRSGGRRHSRLPGAPAAGH